MKPISVQQLLLRLDELEVKVTALAFALQAKCKFTDAEEVRYRRKAERWRADMQRRVR